MSSAMDSDSVNLGSNPSSPANKTCEDYGVLCVPPVLLDRSEPTKQANNAKRAPTKAGHKSVAPSFPSHSDPRLIELERILLKAAESFGPLAYFIKSGVYVKIGFTRSAQSLRQRLAIYRVAAPEGARLIAISPGGEQTEKLLHERLKKYRHRGEWFRLTKPVLVTMRYEGLWPCQIMDRWPYKRASDGGMVQP